MIHQKQVHTLCLPSQKVQELARFSPTDSFGTVGRQLSGEAAQREAAASMVLVWGGGTHKHVTDEVAEVAPMVLFSFVPKGPDRQQQRRGCVWTPSMASVLLLASLKKPPNKVAIIHTHTTCTRTLSKSPGCGVPSGEGSFSRDGTSPIWGMHVQSGHT